MIFRRFVDNLKQQHWMGVFIELVIVILGVFIGLQVDNWNQARQEQNELAISLGNVAQEISNTAWQRENQIEWMREVVSGLDLSLSALDGKHLSAQQQEKAYKALTAIPSLPPPPQRYETLYELQNTGYLSRVPSPKLRAALEELLSESRLAMPFYDMFRRSLTAPDFSPDLVTYGTSLIVKVNFERARKEPMFRRRIVQGRAVFVDQIGSLEGSRNMDCLVLSMLEKEGYRPSRYWVLENMKRIRPNGGAFGSAVDVCKAVSSSQRGHAATKTPKS